MSTSTRGVRRWWSSTWCPSSCASRRTSGASCRGVNLLASALRTAGGVVAWVVPGHTEPSAKDREFFGDEVAELYAGSGGAGTPVERLHPGLDVDAGDLVAEKTARSARFPGSSELPALLAARDVDTLVVTGTVTNVCVEDTVRDASASGLRVVLVADACAAVRDRDHNASLHLVYRSYGDVRSTEACTTSMAVMTSVLSVGWTCVRPRSISLRRSMTVLSPTLRASSQPLSVIHSGAAERKTDLAWSCHPKPGATRRGHRDCGRRPISARES